MEGILIGLVLSILFVMCVFLLTMLIINDSWYDETWGSTLAVIYIVIYMAGNICYIIECNACKDTNYIEEQITKNPEFVPTYLNMNYVWASGIVIGIAILIAIIYGLYKLYEHLQVYSLEYFRIKRQINKLEKVIDKAWEATNDKNSKEVKLLVATKNKLTEQLSLIYVKKGIDIAKNLEIQYKDIDIQKEIDELEALQKLND